MISLLLLLSFCVHEILSTLFLHVLTSGQHFGTLSTLFLGEKKRPFTAVATEPCEFAIISRIGYNRIMKKQLKVGVVSLSFALYLSGLLE